LIDSIPTLIGNLKIGLLYIVIAFLLSGEYRGKIAV
jgi:hypothetical protein